MKNFSLKIQGLRSKIAFVIATHNRPHEFCRLLKSLDSQTYLPNKITIVNGSRHSDSSVCDEFPNLKIKYIMCFPPSGTKQRNLGLKSIEQGMDFVGFLDDDVVLEPDAIEAMMDFWNQADKDVGGAAFNLANHPSLYASGLKSLPLAEKLGLYSSKGGKVLRSGFHTLIGKMKNAGFVEWLPSTAVVWRREVTDEFQFDEWFSGYSYLEDLDFSYRVGKKYKLAFVADAKYYHFPAPGGRRNAFQFGRREVLNRLYFVKKNKELSLTNCYFAIVLRMLLSLYLAVQEKKLSYAARAAGNLAGFINSITLK